MLVRIKPNLNFSFFFFGSFIYFLSERYKEDWFSKSGGKNYIIIGPWGTSLMLLFGDSESRNSCSLWPQWAFSNIIHLQHNNSFIPFFFSFSFSLFTPFLSFFRYISVFYFFSQNIFFIHLVIFIVIFFSFCRISIIPILLNIFRNIHHWFPLFDYHCFSQKDETTHRTMPHLNLHYPLHAWPLTPTSNLLFHSTAGSFFYCMQQHFSV